MHSEKFNLKDNIEFGEGSVVSKQIIKKDTGNITLFAFSEGEGLSEHTAPFDAFVYIVAGEANIIIDGKDSHLKEGEAIVMPANIPHALQAIKDFKMMLCMIKG